MKRIISLVVAFAMLMLCIVTTASAEKVVEVSKTLLTDGFEAPAVGNVFVPVEGADPTKSEDYPGYNGWYADGINAEAANNLGIYEIRESTAFGSKVLRIGRSSSNHSKDAVLMTKNFSGASAEGVIKLSFDMITTQSATVSDLFAVESNYFGRLTGKSWKPYSSSNGEYTFNAEEAELLKNYNQKRKVEIVLDYDKMTSTLYVEGTQMGQSHTLTKMPPIDNIFLFSPKTYDAVNACLIDNLKLEQIDVVFAYNASDVTYSKDGAYINTAVAGSKMTCTVKKAETVDGNCTAVVAFYDEDNKMQLVKISNLSSADFEENKAEIEVDIPADVEDLSGGKLKVLFLESLNTMIPLEEASVFDIPVASKPAFYLFGDSTMSNYNTTDFPRAGTGMMLGKYFDEITVSNYAASGAGTDTALGLPTNELNHNYDWTNVTSRAKAGDYVLIQLGINDAADEIGIQNYKDNLDVLVETLNKKNVNVIMSTMNMTYSFDENGKFRANFDEDGNFTGTDLFTKANGDNYLEALYEYIDDKKAADSLGFMSIDMTPAIAELIGADATPTGEGSRYYMIDTQNNWSAYKDDPRAEGSQYNGGIKDSIHLTIYGADVFAQIMAQKIYNLNTVLSQYVNTDKLDDEIIYPHLDYQYPGSN